MRAVGHHSLVHAEIQRLMEFGNMVSDDLSSHGQLYITLGLVSDI